MLAFFTVFVQDFSIVLVYSLFYVDYFPYLFSFSSQLLSILVFLNDCLYSLFSF